MSRGWKIRWWRMRADAKRWKGWKGDRRCQRQSLGTQAIWRALTHFLDCTPIPARLVLIGSWSLPSVWCLLDVSWTGLCLNVCVSIVCIMFFVSIFYGFFVSMFSIFHVYRMIICDWGSLSFHSHPMLSALCHLLMTAVDGQLDHVLPLFQLLVFIGGDCSASGVVCRPYC